MLFLDQAIYAMQQAFGVVAFDLGEQHGLVDVHMRSDFRPVMRLQDLRVPVDAQCCLGRKLYSFLQISACRWARLQYAADARFSPRATRACRTVAFHETEGERPRDFRRKLEIGHKMPHLLPGHSIEFCSGANIVPSQNQRGAEELEPEWVQEVALGYSYSSVHQVNHNDLANTIGDLVVGFFRTGVVDGHVQTGVVVGLSSTGMQTSTGANQRRSLPRCHAAIELLRVGKRRVKDRGLRILAEGAKQIIIAEQLEHVAVCHLGGDEFFGNEANHPRSCMQQVGEPPAFGHANAKPDGVPLQTRMPLASSATRDGARHPTEIVLWQRHWEETEGIEGRVLMAAFGAT
mmetsp:Transcript_34213/g.94303  ORF Transcript_34213/g.94303 Transcript_34213/m.94303 type:complete len:347 (-) Transcript_34213:1629-2669(-)